VAAPPIEGGCPGLAALAPLWPTAGGPRWIGYLSTTGVYGDRGGGWVREATPPAPASPEAVRRVEAERGWAALAAGRSARFAAFRLPGIYGPGRSPLERVRAGEARRWTRPGQVFSRIHVADLADALARALDRPDRDGPFIVCDDEPAPAAEVTAYACALLGLPVPPEEPLDLDALSPMARRFWSESKRASNARAKAALGWRPAYPSYREGLKAVAEEG
jgi:nucleoside-diphosphate-sugar epimerase